MGLGEVRKFLGWYFSVRPLIDGDDLALHDPSDDHRHVGCQVSGDEVRAVVLLEVVLAEVQKNLRPTSGKVVVEKAGAELTTPKGTPLMTPSRRLSLLISIFWGRHRRVMGRR